MTDVVYMLRSGENNEELRYSLRSLANLPHDKVYLVGGNAPSWVKNVTHIRVPQSGSKYNNTTMNLLTACQDKRISEDFVLMNDDFFVMKPLESLPTFHRGSMQALHQSYEKRGLGRFSYTVGGKKTEKLLRALKKPTFSYELHMPMVMNRVGFIKAFNKAMSIVPPVYPLHKRSFYGNYFEIGGEYHPDVKISGQTHDDAFQAWDFLSTSDVSFKSFPVGAFIRSQFQERSPYEA